MIDFVDETSSGPHRKITKREKKVEIQLKNKLWNNKKNSNESDPSPRFSTYYKAQFPCLSDEWLEFRSMLSVKLPTSFRFSVDRFPISSTILRRQLVSEFNSVRGKYVEINGKPLSSLANPIVWSPNAYQISTVDASSLNQTPELQTLSRLIIRESNLGHICKQELVSMLPALLLTLPSLLSKSLGHDIVQSHHNILDVCASPGSKTDQLVSLLHETYHREKRHGILPAREDKGGVDIPKGMIVANDADTGRVQTIRERYASYNCPNLLVTCARAEDLHAQGIPYGAFNHILADVPCSGDGTFRKSPHLWRNFRPRTGMFIHTIQLQIALASIELLNSSIGSRFVYSTCSLNPLEDESVVTAILRQYGHTLRLVDLKAGMDQYLQVNTTNSHCVDESCEKIKHLNRFKWRAGISHWRTDTDVMVNEEGSDVENSDDDEDDDEEVAQHGKSNKRKHSQLNKEQKTKHFHEQQEKQRSIDKLPALLPSMIPPTAEEAKKFHLERSMRVFHHDQNTGGFYIAVFERYQTPTTAGAVVAASTSAVPSSTASVNKSLDKHNKGRDSSIIAASGTGTEASGQGVNVEKDISVLKNICGFNPKQISLSGVDDTAGTGGELELWRSACNVHNYERLSADALTVLIHAAQKNDKAATVDDKTVKLLQQTIKNANAIHGGHLLLSTRPYEKPEARSKVDQLVPLQPVKGEVLVAAPAAWKGLKFLSVLQPTVAKAVSIPTAAVSSNALSTVANLGHITLVSENISRIIHQWGHKENIVEQKQGQVKAFSTFKNGLIVQGGVDICACVGETSLLEKFIANPLSAVTSNTMCTAVNIISASHNNMNYVSQYFPAFIKRVVKVLNVVDMMKLLDWTLDHASQPGAVLTLSQAVELLSPTLLEELSAAVKCVRVGEDIVLTLSLSMSRQYIQSQHVAATVTGTTTVHTVSSGVVTVGDEEVGMNSTDGAPRQRMSIKERKQMKKQQQSVADKPSTVISVKASTTPSSIPVQAKATVKITPPIPTPVTSVDTANESFSLLICRAKDIYDGKSTEVAFGVKSNMELCDSMHNVLTGFHALN